MDRTPQHLVANFSLNASNNPSKVGDTGVVYSTVAAMQLNSLGLSSFYFSNSKGSKRKLSANDGVVNLQDGSSLVLGLGRLTSSCTTMSSVKEIEDQSSIDLGLSIDLNLGNERTAKQKNKSCVTPKGLEVEKPKLDLELSLSTRSAVSGVTTVVQGFPSFQNNVESPVIAGVRIIE